MSVSIDAMTRAVVTMVSGCILIAAGCLPSDLPQAGNARNSTADRAHENNADPMHWPKPDPIANDLFRADWQPANGTLFRPARTNPSASFSVDWLVRAVDTNDDISTKKLVALSIERQWQRYRSSNKKNASYPLDAMVATFQYATTDQGTGDPHKFKLNYEEAIGRDLNQGVRYNDDALTLAHVLREARLQCYSGTLLHVLAELTLKGGAALRAQHFAVIFENGHLLPGYLVRGRSGFHLYGIESTVGGLGQVYYGPAESVSGTIRVVDALDFILVELLGYRLISPEKILAATVQKTAALYGINAPRNEAAIRQLDATLTHPRGRRALGAFFAFGVSANSAGDQIRVIQDTTSRSPVGVTFRSPEDIFSELTLR